MNTIRCEIRSRPVGNGLELTGVIWANEEVRGDYSFTIRSQGAGGSSNVVQSGIFAIHPNQAKIVGAVVVNSGDGSSYSASLSVRSDGEEVCTTHR